MPYFDRFDICEAWSLAAHDWGQYGVISRLDDMHFRLASGIIGPDDLNANAREIYDAIAARMDVKLASSFPHHDPYARTF